MKIFISFGQIHAHSIPVKGGYKTFDKDCLAGIECKDYGEGRDIAFEAFGPKFMTSYPEYKLPEIMHYFPRGIIPLNYEEGENATLPQETSHD